MTDVVVVAENGKGRYQQGVTIGQHHLLADEPVDNMVLGPGVKLIAVHNASRAVHSVAFMGAWEKVCGACLSNDGRYCSLQYQYTIGTDMRTSL